MLISEARNGSRPEAESPFLPMPAGQRFHGDRDEPYTIVVRSIHSCSMADKGKTCSRVQVSS